MRRVERFCDRGKNPMVRWQRVVPTWRVSFHFMVITIGRYLPWMSAKNWLYRRLGMTIGKNSAIGLMAMFDVFFPGMITIGDNVVIGYNATVLCHEFLVGEYRTGPVVIGNDVMIGANATVLAGVSIGDGAVVGAGAVVANNVASGTMVVGVPARVRAGVDSGGGSCGDGGCGCRPVERSDGGNTAHSEAG